MAPWSKSIFPLYMMQEDIRTGNHFNNQSLRPPENPVGATVRKAVRAYKLKFLALLNPER